MKNFEIWLAAHRDEIIAQWFELLRFPSIGAESARLADCRACAAWLERWLAPLGFANSRHGADSAPPVVFAARPADPARAGDPAIFIYGHYDVQPVDPTTDWTTPPFEPAIRGSRVYARGAQDNKGQLWWTLQAVRAAIETGAPLPEIKIVLDGQEESGSAELSKLLRTPSLPLAAGALLVADTSAAGDGRPALTAGLRGVTMISFRVRGANRDLHSGVHGGVAPNPAAALARIIALMHNPDGSIAVEGFMDAAAAPPPAELGIARAIPFDPARYEAETGVAPVGGQRGVAPEIRAAFQPTIEINGLHSGYAGEGSKTIIPATAEVKLSMRTVPGQTPAKILDTLRAHFRKHLPAGLRLEEIFAEKGARALRIGVDSRAAKTAVAILGALDERGCAVVYEGASIHIIEALAAASGAEPILAGFGLEDDRIHAVDESYSFEQAADNFRFAARFLAEFKHELKSRAP